MHNPYIQSEAVMMTKYPFFNQNQFASINRIYSSLYISFQFHFSPQTNLCMHIITRPYYLENSFRFLFLCPISLSICWMVSNGASTNLSNSFCKNIALLVFIDRFVMIGIWSPPLFKIRSSISFLVHINSLSIRCLLRLCQLTIQFNIYITYQLKYCETYQCRYIFISMHTHKLSKLINMQIFLSLYILYTLVEWP